MIWETSYWKNDLLKQSSELKRRMAQKRWVDASFARCEQTIMMGFYSVRKLIDSMKLTDTASNNAHQVYSYPPTGKDVTLLNKRDLDELYDLRKPRRQNASLRFLCNQVIHSYVFCLVFDEQNMLSAVWVASDFYRSKALLEVSLIKIVELFETVSTDVVWSSRYTYDPKKGDYCYQAD